MAGIGAMVGGITVELKAASAKAATDLYVNKQTNQASTEVKTEEEVAQEPDPGEGGEDSDSEGVSGTDVPKSPSQPPTIDPENPETCRSLCRMSLPLKGFKHLLSAGSPQFKELPTLPRSHVLLADNRRDHESGNIAPAPNTSFGENGTRSIDLTFESADQKQFYDEYMKESGKDLEKANWQRKVEAQKKVRALAEQWPDRALFSYKAIAYALDFEQLYFGIAGEPMSDEDFSSLCRTVAFSEISFIAIYKTVLINALMKRKANFVAALMVTLD